MLKHKVVVSAVAATGGLGLAACGQAAVHPQPAPTHTVFRQPPKPSPAPSTQTPATSANGSACTTVSGYYVAGQAGHYNAAQKICVPDTPQYSPSNCPPANYGYGIVNGQCVKIPVGTGQYSQECVKNYGQAFPYLVGTHCEAHP